MTDKDTATQAFLQGAWGAIKFVLIVIGLSHVGWWILTLADTIRKCQ